MPSLGYSLWVGARASQDVLEEQKTLVLLESEPQVIQPLAQLLYWAMLFHIPHI